MQEEDYTCKSSLWNIWLWCHQNPSFTSNN